MIDLEKIRERWAKVTPGTWWARKDLAHHRAYWYVWTEYPINPRDIVSETEEEQIGTIVIDLSDNYGHTDADAHAITNAPTDIAALIEEVERLREAVMIAVAANGTYCKNPKPPNMSVRCGECVGCANEAVRLAGEVAKRHHAHTSWGFNPKSDSCPLCDEVLSFTAEVLGANDE